MDISVFDFSLEEMVGVLPRLSSFAEMIEIEPRLHRSDEEIHDVAGPTFRVRCHLRGGEDSIRTLAALEAETNVRVVLEHDSTVRLRHAKAAAPAR